MPARVMSRPSESRVVDDFLDSAALGPAALVIDGDPGIGKTTLWLSALEQAHGQGFRVLEARPTAADSASAYTSLGDLLAGVDEAVLDTIPAPQRRALNQVLLWAEADGVATNQRVVGAAFLSVVTRLAQQTPLLLAIDDLHWLDSSSVSAIAFALRRLAGRVGMVATVRIDRDSANATSWLRLRRPDELRRFHVQPLSLSGLREVIAARLGQSLPRPTMVRLHEISGGNPFYALELARALDGASSPDAPLPSTLAGLVQARIGNLGHDADDVLLAAACIATPTVDLVARATGTEAEGVVGRLQEAEKQGVVGIEGNRLHFGHPLLARSVYLRATPMRRREMHRRLAEIVEEPELQARHLAKAVAWADEHTLQCLDSAAELAGIRGASTAAAELLDLAAGLGGDTPERRIRSASHHFNAGDFDRARTLLEQTIEEIGPGTVRAQALGLVGLMESIQGSLTTAAAVLHRALHEAGDDLALRVQILVPLAFAQWNIGHRTAALPTIDGAVADAERLGRSHLLSQALGMRSLVQFLQGKGVDQASMRRALELEDRQVSTSLLCRPTMHNAMLLAFSGQLQQAREEMRIIEQRCGERAEESDQVFIAFHSVLIDIWRGNLSDATSIAERAMDSALLLGGGLPRAVALTMCNALAAYAGREDEVRRDTAEAREGMEASGSLLLAAWPTTILGFLEVSLGNYEAALTALEPLLSALDPDATEIFVAPFVPDAVEALIHVGRFSEAEPLVGALEHNGQQLDRAWMSAIGARCRSMLSAAYGEVEAATLAAQRAMTEHERLPMPFERARTQLFLGKLQRRQRHRDAATATLREARDAFERIGTPLWGAHARAELARADVGRGTAGELTPSERQVAELAASGMSNRNVAATLFISPKTVEVNLYRVYQKLGIHSRAELGRLMGQSER